MLLKKRFLLPVILIPFLPLIFKETIILQNFYIQTPLICICFYVIFLNFPSLISKYYIQPIYFHDLLDSQRGTRYQKIFVTSSQIGVSISLTVLVYYYIYKYRRSSLNNVEIFGIMGGFISLVNKIFSLFKFLMIAIYCKKNNDEMIILEHIEDNKILT